MTLKEGWRGGGGPSSFDWQQKQTKKRTFKSQPVQKVKFVTFRSLHKRGKQEESCCHGFLTHRATSSQHHPGQDGGCSQHELAREAPASATFPLSRCIVSIQANGGGGGVMHSRDESCTLSFEVPALLPPPRVTGHKLTRRDLYLSPNPGGGGGGKWQGRGRGDLGRCEMLLR